MGVLTVMRHGEAEARGPDGDESRALSLQGIRTLQEQCAGLRAIGHTFDAVYCSPLVRTAQTARIVADAICPNHTPTLINALAPGTDPERVVRQLSHRWGEETLVVGHLPDVSYLMGFLTCGDLAGIVAFAPGTMACIDFPALPRAGAGTIRWVLTPTQLARLGTAS